MSRRRKITRIVSGVIVAFVALQVATLAGVWSIGIQEPGYVTYAIDCKLGSVAVDGARDAFAAWDDMNDALILEESDTWAEADIRVAHKNAFFSIGGYLVNGCGCIGLSPMCPVESTLLGCSIPWEATMRVSPGMYDSDGNMLGMYTREQMRDLVAHEFGHNLGLRHNVADADHLMHSQYELHPYSDSGYNVPQRLEGGNMTIGLPASEWTAPESCAVYPGS